MLGLIPAPEPKFKLSNFMKVLGDQAIADPSRVELKVIQQMQQRILNHEMRNQAAKLTPKERKEKKTRKLMEDVSKGIHVAVFRVTDFSSLKHRFKVDVNAQQLFLSGLVLLCQDDTKNKNLVVVEGGPKAVRKFIRLMVQRIRWEESGEPSTNESRILNEEGGWNYQPQEQQDEAGDGEAGAGEDDDQSVDDEENNDDENLDSLPKAEEADKNKVKRCDLLWQGIVPRKLFAGFKYQETKSSSAAKKMLEAKGAAHYWDMIENADSLLATTSQDDTNFF